jgi:hypothetical protein
MRQKSEFQALGRYMRTIHNTTMRKAAAGPGNPETSPDASDSDDGQIPRKSAFALITKLVKAGVWVPIEIVIARPFIEHLMLSSIVAVAGRDTGATLFGPAGTR